MTSTDDPVNLPDDKTYTISYKDVQLLLTLVNVVSSRGGFKPAEFKLVGELFDKLSNLTAKEEDVQA
jgi:hypothetical protein|tara:strand:+ start:9487 stop:9687 length:201 start_codon:yes stop_codon:yes gene_type:complete